MLRCDPGISTSSQSLHSYKVGGVIHRSMNPYLADSLSDDDYVEASPTSNETDTGSEDEAISDSDSDSDIIKDCDPHLASSPMILRSLARISLPTALVHAANAPPASRSRSRIIPDTEELDGDEDGDEEGFIDQVVDEQLQAISFAHRGARKRARSIDLVDNRGRHPLVFATAQAIPAPLAFETIGQMDYFNTMFFMAFAAGIGLASAAAAAAPVTPSTSLIGGEQAAHLPRSTTSSIATATAILEARPGRKILTGKSKGLLGGSAKNSWQKCYHCCAVTRPCDDNVICDRCATHVLQCERPAIPWTRKKFTPLELERMLPLVDTCLPEGRLATDKPRGKRISILEEKALVKASKEFSCSPDALRNKLVELRDWRNGGETRFWPPTNQWGSLDQVVLAEASRLRMGTLKASEGLTANKPPFDKLVVVSRVSGEGPRDTGPQTYGDLQAASGWASLGQNAKLCASVYLKDHGWQLDDAHKHFLILGPFASSSTRAWPANKRLSDIHETYFDLISLLHRFTQSASRVMILSIGLDGFTSSTRNVIGIREDHRKLKLSITVMMGFHSVTNMAAEYLKVFDSSASSYSLYTTFSLIDVVKQQGGARVISKQWEIMTENKLGVGKEHQRGMGRNSQGFHSYEYASLVVSCALCLRKFGSEKAVKLHFENEHAKAFRCRRCYGTRPRARFTKSFNFATQEELDEHQQTCTLEAMRAQIEANGDNLVDDEDE